ncbi:MAG: zf-HC2 domain-containing protein [Planctomycetota bacterium]|nr:MAG: zf-HC2 domain-containing protein [Planctomycetota bacterium]
MAPPRPRDPHRNEALGPPSDPAQRTALPSARARPHPALRARPPSAGPRPRSAEPAAGLACAFARERASAALDAELAPREQELLSAHLGGCPSCRAHAARLRRLLGFLAALRERPAKA